MKVLLLNGSPNKDGSCKRILNEMKIIFDNEGIIVSMIDIGNKPISGCIDCEACRNNPNHCIIDDLADKVINELHEADGIVIASPVYYASPNGSLISLLDRVFHAGKDFRFKVGASIVALRRSGATASNEVINKYFSIYEMPIITSNYWNSVHGNNALEVEQDLEGMQTARILARNVSWFIKAINIAKENGLEIPLKENRNSTNFIR